MLMVMVHVTGRMGAEPILSIKRSISIDTMINFDSDGDGHGDVDGMCKQAFTWASFMAKLWEFSKTLCIPVSFWDE